MRTILMASAAILLLCGDAKAAMFDWIETSPRVDCDKQPWLSTCRNDNDRADAPDFERPEPPANNPDPPDDDPDPPTDHECEHPDKPKKAG